MKNYLLAFLPLAIASVNAHAQVGINTTNPNATFEVASSETNSNIVDGIIPPKLTGENLKNKENLYTVNQTGSIVYVTEGLDTEDRSEKTINIDEVGYYYFDGNIWQKLKGTTQDHSTINARNGITKAGDNVKLGGTLNEVTAITTSNTNTLRLNGLQDANASSGKILIVDNSNNVRTVKDLASDLSIPTPAIFRLNATQNNFLRNQTSGSKSVVNMSLIKNSISGLSFNSSTRTITFPKGIFQIMFVYEATHNAANCTISSYMVDFPRGNTTQRIHNTASHNQGATSNHGGVITYTTIINTPRQWRIELGRGQSGNCTGAGMSLTPESTHLLIYRIGDN